MKNKRKKEERNHKRERDFTIKMGGEQRIVSGLPLFRLYVHFMAEDEHSSSMHLNSFQNESQIHIQY